MQINTPQFRSLMDKICMAHRVDGLDLTGTWTLPFGVSGCIDWKRSLVGCHKGLLSTKHWERVETNKVVVDKHSQPKDRHPSPIKKGKKGNVSKI